MYEKRTYTHVTMYVEIKHNSAKIFFELAMDNEKTMPDEPSSKYGVDNPYICQDTAIFVTGIHRTAIAKTAIIVLAIRDHDVGLQSAFTPRENFFQTINTSC